MTEVKIGQIWVDNDKRQAVPRRLRVVGMVDDVAVTKAWVQNVETGRKTKVSLDRFRPTHNGYRLEEDPK